MKTAHAAVLAVIRENECIGCTKCIQACPFDAIIGAQNLMHTVLTDICNGCKLCIAPCPVDCIDLIELPERSPDEKRALAEQSRDRLKKRKARLEKDEAEQREKHARAKNEIKAALRRMRDI